MVSKQTKAHGKAIPGKDINQAGSGDAGPSVPTTVVFHEDVGLVALPLSALERHEWITQAAYFRAQERGFAAGHELEDWFAAASELDQLLASAGRQAH